MSLLLIRVDDRLIHGQVTLGWGSILNPDRFVVANDAAAENDWEKELYETSAPEGTEVSVLGLAEVARAVRKWLDRQENIVILVESPADALLLHQSGFSFEALNLGGLHHQEGRKRILPYVCLGREDLIALETLRDLGVKIECADVPSCERKDLFECLGSMVNGN